MEVDSETGWFGDSPLLKARVRSCVLSLSLVGVVQIGLASFSPGSFTCFSEAVEGRDGDSRLFKLNARTRRGIDLCDLFLGLLGVVQIGLASFSPGSFSYFSEAVEGGDGDSRLFKFNARTRRGICDLFLGLLGVVQIGLASFSPGSFTCFSEAAEGGDGDSRLFKFNARTRRGKGICDLFLGLLGVV